MSLDSAALPRHNPREPQADVDPMFTDRWSPRAFASTPLTPSQVASLFEAARWAPSSMNEQPWLFVYAVSTEDRARFADALVEGNRVWAKEAPLLFFIAVRRYFAKRPERLNPTADFDAGAAWMALALQARKLGLHSHAMAGFDADKAYEVTGLDAAKHQLIAAVAVGHRASAAALPDALAGREEPSPRAMRGTFVYEGLFNDA